MYVFFLTIHSGLRWVVLALLIVSLVLAVRGWMGSRTFDRGQNRLALATLITTHFQLLFGLMLYFLFSPYSRVLFNDPGYAMRTHEFRYWGVEHTLVMIVGIVFVTVGFSLAKRAEEHVRKQKRVAIFFGLGLLAFLAGIPWPFLETIGRPWMRFFS